MNLAIEIEREDDGGWIAEINELNGVLVYGEPCVETILKAKTLTLHLFKIG